MEHAHNYESDAFIASKSNNDDVRILAAFIKESDDDMEKDVH